MWLRIRNTEDVLLVRNEGKHGELARDTLPFVAGAEG